MSVPEVSCSIDKLVIENVTQVSSESSGGATVIKVLVSENSKIDTQTPTDKDEITRTTNFIKDSKELEECSEQIDSSIVSVPNSVDDPELNMDQSSAKKNRRKKKKKKDGGNLVNDREDAQHSQSNNTDPDIMKHLNKVFTIWGITESNGDGESEDSVNSAVGTKYKQVENDYKIGMNTAGTSAQISRVSDENVQQERQILECSSAVQIQQRLGSHCSASTGKSKLTEKRRKMKNLPEQRSKNAETVCEEGMGNSEIFRLGNCPRNITAVEQASCSFEAQMRSESAKIRTKKKLALEEGSNVLPIDNSSQDLTKSMNELYRLLKMRTTNNLSSIEHRNIIEVPGRSQPSNEYQNTTLEMKSNLKSQRKMSQELVKLDKMLKKKMRKQEVASENQSKNKKKEKLKIKKGITTSASGDVLDHPETSTPTQKSPEKIPKKKTQQFEEYWTLDAVKEALQKGTVFEGPIRINARRYTEAYVASPTGEQDILIEGITDRNRALEGDLVAVQLKDPSEWKVKHKSQEKRNSNTEVDTSEIIEEEEGEITSDFSGIECDPSQKPQVTAKVVAILSKQHSRKCVGYLKLMKKPNEKTALFSPRDARIPRMQIPQYKCPKDFWQDPASKENTLYMGKMMKWTSGSFALGEIVKEIGESSDVNAETEAILLDNDLDVSPYPEEISKKYSSITLDVNEELKKREDLRKECIFTIDPQSAKDLDDAVSCKALENGNLEIGVHISDVTYFLEEGSDLDNEVSKRATSVYLVDTVHHMLPVELCLLCSLSPGEDKFAYSVIWEISKNDAKIISQRVVRSVIQSCVKLAYEHAQAMIDNPNKEWDSNDFPAIGNGFSLPDISKVVNDLQVVAKKLRCQRFEGGALRIDQTKLFLELDPLGTPTAVHEYINIESHRLIEEFMLLANMTTAKFIYDSYPDIAFLRCHPEPHRWPLEQLQNAMASRGIHLNITTAGDLQASLEKYSGADFLSQARHMVLNSLCAKTMTRAKYFCSGDVQEEEFWHYALSVPFYTHFTSPIRRYSDVMVHRLLNATLNYCSKPLWSESHVAGIAANCNKKKYSAKIAGEQSIKLYLAIYLKNQQPAIEDAVVVDVKDHSFDVIVVKYGLTMRVYISKLNVDLANDPSQKSSPMKIIWNSDDQHALTAFQVVDVFTIVKVLIRCDESLKLEAVLIRPETSDRLPSQLEET